MLTRGVGAPSRRRTRASARRQPALVELDDCMGGRGQVADRTGRASRRAIRRRGELDQVPFANHPYTGGSHAVTTVERGRSVERRSGRPSVAPTGGQASARLSQVTEAVTARLTASPPWRSPLGLVGFANPLESGVQDRVRGRLTPRTTRAIPKPSAAAKISPSAASRPTSGPSAGAAAPPPPL